MLPDMSWCCFAESIFFFFHFTSSCWRGVGASEWHDNLHLLLPALSPRSASSQIMQVPYVSKVHNPRSTKPDDLIITVACRSRVSASLRTVTLSYCLTIMGSHPKRTHSSTLLLAIRRLPAECLNCCGAYLDLTRGFVNVFATILKDPPACETSYANVDRVLFAMCEALSCFSAMHLLFHIDNSDVK